MRVTISLMLVFLVWVTAQAQTRDEVVAGRAREFHKVMCQKDREIWRQFVTDNYTKALQERQMKSQVAGPSGTKSETHDQAIEGKVKMFERLNQDFGASKLVSVVVEGDDVTMTANTADGMVGKFKFKFEKSSPYLIDAIAIEVGD